MIFFYEVRLILDSSQTKLIISKYIKNKNAAHFEQHSVNKQ